MRKILTIILLILVFNINLFAKNSQILNLEFDLKLGLDFNPTLALYDMHSEGLSNEGLAYEFSNSFLLGMDFFFLKFSNLYLGVGINHIFESKIKTKGYDAKSNITTYHIAGKYKMPLESKIFSNLYLIGNIGYANTNIDDIENILNLDEEDSDLDIRRITKFDSNNFFWGIGFGTEFLDNFIAELTYSIIYENAKRETIITEYPDDIIGKTKLPCKTNYSLIMFKVGYKFNIDIPQSKTKSNKNETLDKEIEKLKLQKEILQLEIEKEKLKQ